MQSKADGKKETIAWIQEHFPINSSILDVGTGHAATYRKLLPEYPNMYGVEVFPSNADKVKDLYKELYNVNIMDFDWTDKFYDLIIFGDILEHLTIQDAQKILKIAAEHCQDLIVAVPFEYPQGICYGNKYEIHLQPDLTKETMAERYPDLEILVDPGNNYCYYHKKFPC